MLYSSGYTKEIVSGLRRVVRGCRGVKGFKSLLRVLDLGFRDWE